MSRTQKSIKNIIYNLLNVFLTLVLMFTVRTVFINTLGVTYLGLDGVFKNIFQFLSLAELGIGSAISYRLYKPLNEKNERRVATLMVFFRKAYQVISILIIIMALVLLPFLSVIIGDQAPNVNIFLVYTIYVLQTLSSYAFFAYKIILIQADQREYVIAKYSNYLIVISSLAEIFVLYFFHSYISYLLIIVFSNILRNYLVSRKVDKDYSYIQKYDDKLDKEELKDMYKDFFSAFLYRINNVVLKSTDNLILSYFVNLEIVGLYSNYVLIESTLDKFIRPIFQSLKASLGSFIAQKSSEESYEMFKIINVLSIVLYGSAATGVYLLSNRFITLWIGEEFTLSTIFVFILTLEFYFRGQQNFLAQIRNAMGLFQELKFRPILSMIINLVGSIILVQRYSIEGVLLATVISSVLTNLLLDPIVIHNKGFKVRYIGFFIKNIYYVALLILTITVSTLLTQNLQADILGLIYTFIITSLVILVIYGVGLVFLKEFRVLISRVLKIFKS